MLSSAPARFLQRCAPFADVVVLLAALELFLSPEWSGGLPRAVALLSLLAWGLLRGRDLRLRGLAGAPGAWMIVGYGLLLLGERSIDSTTGGCLLVGGLAALWTASPAAARAFPAACAAIAVLWLGDALCPWLQVPLRAVWSGWSRVLGVLGGREWDIGPTFQGARLLLPCMVLLCVRFLWVEARPRRLALGLGLLAAASVLQLVLLDATTGMPTHLLAWSPWLGAGVPAVIATAWLVTAPADQSPAAAAGPWPAALCALAALTMLAGLHVHVVDPVARPRIVLYGANEGPILDWKKPRFGEYGPYSMGMFGLLPDYLAKDGFEVGHLDESITPERLVGADVLVLINVNTRWSEDELLAVWTFVQDGGSLLVLGDHTNVENSRGSLNDVLAPFGIEFEFDSAFPASPSGWLQSILYPHQALARVERPDQLGISIGASLRLSHAGALPLVVGRHGLADAGDSSAVERAYLGDYRYRRGEPLGDLVLAAWRRFGAGRVVVFGDTSGFQNTVLERTWDPFVRDLFAWLGGDVRIDLGLAGSVVLGILFLLSSLAAVAQARDRALLLGGIVLALWCTSVVGLASLGGRLQRPASNVPRILIDMSHLQRLAPSLDGERDLDGFRNTALRSGYVVDNLESLSERGLEGASMLVTVAPRRPYTTREAALLGRFMERGGFVLACASQPQSAGLRELLDLVGLQVLPRPVGSIPLDRAGDRVRDRVEYLDAWQVGPMESPAPDEPWVYGEFEGLPLAMLARHGQGGLFLVGDSRFFSSANLEHGTSVSEPNIHFLRALFADVEAFRSEVRR